MDLSVVIPIYNEEKIIKDSVSRLTEYLRSTGVSFEILVSDDGSRDSGAGIVSSLSQKYGEIRLLCNPINRGKGAAVKDGMLRATGDFVVFTDCDLAYGETVIYEIFNRLKSGAADVIIGSRTLHPSGYEGYSPFRRAVSENYLKMLSRTFKIPHSDFQCGLKGFTASAKDKIFPSCTVSGFAFDLEVLMLADKLGLKVSEIPVKVLSEVKHKSKVKMLPEAIKMIKDVGKIKKMRHVAAVSNGETEE